MTDNDSSNGGNMRALRDLQRALTASDSAPVAEFAAITLAVAEDHQRQLARLEIASAHQDRQLKLLELRIASTENALAALQDLFEMTLEEDGDGN